MAKSIFEILDSLETETSVPAVNKIVEHSLPRKLFPTAEQFESPELLKNWADSNGFTHSLLQAGIQKGLIDCRAAFKSVKKGETWTEESGQAKVDAMNWTVTSRPKTGNKVANAIDTLSKLTPEQLAVIMAQIKAAQGQPE
jgi:hypothetical protein